MIRTCDYCGANYDDGTPHTCDTAAIRASIDARVALADAPDAATSSAYLPPCPYCGEPFNPAAPHTCELAALKRRSLAAKASAEG